MKFDTQADSNMQNLMAVFSLSFVKWKNCFWKNLVQKIKIICSKRNLKSRLIRICRIQRYCSVYLFQGGKLFLGKFGPKNQNCQFKLKFGTQTNLNMQDSVIMFVFFVFDQKYPFMRKLVCSKKSKLFVETEIQNID